MQPVLRMIAAVGMIGVSAPSHAQADWAAVEQIFGREATQPTETVHRFGFPRSDLAVTLDGVDLAPGFALGSWVAFEEMGGQVMAMGDLVLTEEEIAPVMSRLVEGGIAVTAVHQHVLRAEPLPMYMHIEGHGDPAALAETIRAALALSGTPLQPPAAGGQAEEPALDTAALDQAIGHPGKANGGIYQFSIPRVEDITQDGMAVPAALGTAIAINFQPTGDGRAAITGDFVLTAEEVNPVVRALREHNIEVTALHNHMLNEEPRLFFMHFWANDDALKLAQGLAAALAETNAAED